MKFFFFLFLFIPLISNSKEIISDKALFRVAEEIIFLSDLKGIQDFIEKVRCLKTDGLTLGLLGLDKKSLPKIPSVKNFDVNKDKEFIQKIILFKKVGHFIDTQNISLDANIKALIEKDSCIGISYSKWSPDLKRFFDIEVYIQKRFVVARGKGSKDNQESTKNSAKVFLTSLGQKLPHYVFY
jgi:hypothetical protein